MDPYPPQFSRIKVAHVITLDTSVRVLLLDQLLSLKRMGFDMTVISSDGEDVPAIKQAGIHHFPVTFTRSWLTPVSDLKALIALYRIYRQERFTIVHTHFPKPGLIGRIAAKLAGIPIVVNTVHGFYIHDQMHPIVRNIFIRGEKIATNITDLVLSQNHEDIQLALEEGICGPEKIKYLGNGIDLARFTTASITPEIRSQTLEAFNIPEGRPIVGFVGRLAGRRKGFLDFLAAAQYIRQKFPQVVFLIVGKSDPGKSDAITPEIAHAYDLETNCRFIGWRPNEDLPTLYSLMNVLVLPSLFEGVPRTLMEACAMGVPIVATNVKGNRDVVENERNGMLVPYGDPMSIAQCVVRILQDSTLALKLGAEGKKIAAERFDENKVFETVILEYTRLLKLAAH